MMKLNPEAAQNVRFRELVKAMPRVTYLEGSRGCDAFAGKRTSVGTYYHPDPEIRAAKQARAACRNSAHWQFTELKPKDEWDYCRGKTYVYCWSHLIHHGIYGDMHEEAATKEWLKRHGEVE